MTAGMSDDDSIFRDPLADGSLGLEMVWVPRGDFTMGDTQGVGEENEAPVHQVAIEGFALGRYEVTVGQFECYVEATGHVTDAEKQGDSLCFDGKWYAAAGASWRNPGFAQSARHPVACVSWNDALAYLAWLSEQAGSVYRLPTEAEWEYAARAGSDTAWYWGDDPSAAGEYANVADRTAREVHPNMDVHECTDGHVHTAPVGSYAPNAFGLYDMVGNQWEWTGSRFSERYEGEELVAADPGAVSADQQMAVRGGSWFDGVRRTRSAGRGMAVPANRYSDVGFRVAKVRS